VAKNQVRLFVVKVLRSSAELQNAEHRNFVEFKIVHNRLPTLPNPT
jgi:hypothetical protein